MITLWTAGFFVTLGFLTWAFGYATNHPDVSLLGCIIVLGLGVMMIDGGLQHRTGERQVVNETTNTTSIEYEYSRVETPTHFPFSTLVMLVGSVGSLHSLARFSSDS